MSSKVLTATDIVGSFDEMTKGQESESSTERRSRALTFLALGGTQTPTGSRDAQNDVELHPLYRAFKNGTVPRRTAPQVPWAGRATGFAWIDRSGRGGG